MEVMKATHAVKSCPETHKEFLLHQVNKSMHETASFEQKWDSATPDTNSSAKHKGFVAEV